MTPVFLGKAKHLFFPAFCSLAFVLSSCGDNSTQPAPRPEDNVSQELYGATHAGQQHNTQGDMHNPHSSIANAFAHKDIVLLASPYHLSEPTTAEMEQVITAYLQVSNALFNDDENAAGKAAGLLADKVAAVIPTRLEGKGLEVWKNHQALYETKLKEMQHATGLESKRSYFSHISEIMYCTIKSFGLKQGDLFAVFCPMAFDGKGAYWITGTREIHNPYFGKKMPTCGEIKETL